MHYHSEKHRIYLFGLAIVLITIAIYAPARNHAFINFDDNVYVTSNAEIKDGITPKGLIRAFQFPKEGDKTYFHPLSFLSHMIDCEIFGLNPAGHHMMNIGFHIINSLLLFLLLRQVDLRIHQSALIAVIFAIHPLQVETVAWVAERKNLLSTLFWFLTLSAYVQYNKKPHMSKYVIMTLFFILGLLAKPILLTLPCTLLLFDLWPLKRFRFPEKTAQNWIQPISPAELLALLRQNLHLFIEKIPLFIITVLWFFVSIHAAGRLNESPNMMDISLQLRLANGIVSYIQYIMKFFWPFNLAVFYPYPRNMLPLWQIGGALICLTVISIYTITNVKSKPYLASGWFWFLGTLFPALGLTQTGLWPAMADRWMYVPMLGLLFILLGDMGNKAIGRSTYITRIVWLTLAGITTILGFLSHSQLKHWKNQSTLFEHAAMVTNNNYYAHYCIGLELLNQNKNKEALNQFLEAKEYNPESYLILVAIGQALIGLDNCAEAMPYLQSVLKVKPRHDPAIFLLGMAYLNSNKIDQALNFFESAEKLNPRMPLYHNGVGLALMKKGRPDEAEKHFMQTLALDPNNADAQNYLSHIKKILNRRPNNTES